MAVIRNGTTNVTRLSELTELLLRELREGANHRQPIIFENQIGHTNHLAVTVVWDEWRDMSAVARARAILAAYQFLDDRRDRVAVATGYTFPEAIEAGVFPFAVIPVLRKTDAYNREQVLDALTREGATETPTGLELRFQTLQEAEEAFKRLEKTLPGIWAISQTVSAADVKSVW